MDQKAAPTQTEDILNSILPPREWTEDGQLWVQYVSSTPATRLDVIALQERLDQALQQRQVWAAGSRHARASATKPAAGTSAAAATPSYATPQARETGICPVREELYAQCFDELIRQVTINCAERGLLLLRVRDELRMTLAAYQTLYESSLAFGMRKALMTEQGKGELEARVTQLEASSHDLERQVTEWRLKCEAIEKREVERREGDAKKHKDEVAYLEGYARQLKAQLEAHVAPQRKAAGGGGAPAIAPAAVTLTA